jgi:maltose alpha-D-glucosyltransferase/alpha-amylase
MQWSPDRNAGFSRGDFAQLYLPPLMDPVYGYQSVNVEAQQRSPSSFLHWIRRMLQVRKAYLQFGTGGFEPVDCANPSVLAYVRAPEQGQQQALDSGVSASGVRASGVPASGVSAVEPAPVLCVHNLSRFAQPAWLDLVRWAGRTPVELLGRVPFPAVAGGLTHMTLGPHGFYWFELVEETLLDPEPAPESF